MLKYVPIKWNLQWTKENGSTERMFQLFEILGSSVVRNCNIRHMLGLRATADVTYSLCIIYRIQFGDFFLRKCVI